MADKSFSLGQINITDYLIVVCYLASDPHAEISRQVFGPNPPTTQNFTFTDLDNDLYLFSVYESADGSTLSRLFNTYEIDVATNTTLVEWRFYHVDGSQTYDPTNGTASITDDYLTGKTVASFGQRGIGPLVPSDEWSRTMGGVGLVGELKFAADDIYYAVISYQQAGSSSSSAGKVGPLGTEVTIDSNVTLDSSYNNKTINLNGGAARLAAFFQPMADIPDGTHFYFTDQLGGLQYQARIVAAASETIKWMGIAMNELWVGKGEFLWVKKTGGQLIVWMDHFGLHNVGRRFAGARLTQSNTLPEDGALYNAADYPRLFWYIEVVEGGFVDDNIDNVGYVRPANRQGQFLYSIAKQKFRMPDMQGMMNKGLASFDSPGGDSTRLVDVVGGYQPDLSPDHIHPTHAGGPINGAAGNLFLNRTGSGAQAHRFAGGGTDNLGGSTTADPTMLTGSPTVHGAEGTVKNVGVIYCRAI